MIGLPAFVPYHMVVRAHAVSAARRHRDYALECGLRLREAFSSSELHPLAALGPHVPLDAHVDYTPIHLSLIHISEPTRPH